MAVKCKNCDTTFEGNFCNHCGQSANTQKLNKGFLFHSVQYGLLHFDKGILFTIKELFTRPGYAIKDYLDGKRIKYFKPISFVLLLAGTYGFAVHFLNINLTLPPLTDDNPSNELNRSIMNWIYSHFSFVSLMILPFAALSTFWAFRKEDRNYIEHVVLNSYLAGLQLISELLFLPAVLLISPVNQWKSLYISTAILVVFKFWALFQIFDNLPLKKRVTKIILSFIIFAGLILCASIILGIIIGVFLLSKNNSIA